MRRGVHIWARGRCWYTCSRDQRREGARYVLAVPAEDARDGNVRATVLPLSEVSLARCATCEWMGRQLDGSDWARCAQLGALVRWDHSCEMYDAG